MKRTTKKFAYIMGTLILTASPIITNAASIWNGFWNQPWTNIWVPGWNEWWTWNTHFLDFVQNGVNWILGILWLITIILLIWWGFQMITAAWDDTKYKKWFTILKQAVVWLIMIWVSALIVNLIFSFVNTNTTTTNWSTWS